MFETPQNEQHWLERLVGEWTYESHAVSDKGEALDADGFERVRTLGGLWIVGESEGTMPGGHPARAIITLGFDPARQRYVGTWIGSIMTHLWLYDGVLDAAGRVLTLNSEGPSMSADGSMARYQDVIAIESDDHRRLIARVQTADGSWKEFMTTD